MAIEMTSSRAKRSFVLHGLGAISSNYGNIFIALRTVQVPGPTKPMSAPNNAHWLAIQFRIKANAVPYRFSSEEFRFGVFFGILTSFV